MPDNFVRVPMVGGGELVKLTHLNDGRVMCCHCLEYKTRDQLEPDADVPGVFWDVCSVCAKLERLLRVVMGEESP